VEQVACGDETGRFQQNIGQVMSGIFTSQNVNLRFSDFRATEPANQTEKAPDIACSEKTGSMVCWGTKDPLDWSSPAGQP
jgi:hypothetical protein